jgi:hypothetical protein
MIVTWFAAALASPVQLGHQGRLVDSSGAAVDGPHSVTVTVYKSATSTLPADVVHQETFASLPVDDGFFAVTLGASPSNLLDSSELDVTELWVGARLDGGTELPRMRLWWSPRAAIADRLAAGARAASYVVLGGATDADCGPNTEGALAWDATANRLKVCDGARFVGVGVPFVSLGADGLRRWSDGTLATSCATYRTPTSLRSYEGDVGNGWYEIDPESDGTGFRAWCEMSMDGGGWTLILKTAAGSTTWQYTSVLWGNTAVQAETTAGDVAGDAKYPAYNSLPFTRIRGCATNATANCVAHTFSSGLTNARALFDGAARTEGVVQSSFYSVFSPSGMQSCGMNRPGFNIVNTDNNAYRWGFANNVPSQSCQTASGDDTDGVIGWGLRGQDCGATGAGYTNYFVSDTECGGQQRSVNSWIWVK